MINANDINYGQKIEIERTKQKMNKTMDRNTIRNSFLVFSFVSAFSISACSSVNGPSEVEPGGATVDLDDTQQLIRGFGGVNMPGWIPDLTDDQVNKAFGTASGQIGMSILRIRVSFDSAEFNLEVPAAQLAVSLGAIMIASPWTPPVWMKSNNNIVGGGSTIILMPPTPAI